MEADDDFGNECSCTRGAVRCQTGTHGANIIEPLLSYSSLIANTIRGDVGFLMNEEGPGHDTNRPMYNLMQKHLQSLTLFITLKLYSSHFGFFIRGHRY